MSAYRRASGATTLETAQTRVLYWTFEYGGQNGSEMEVRSGGNERTDDYLGPTHTAFGTLHGVDWSMNENGEVVTEQGIHRGMRLDDSAFHAATESSEAVSLIGYITQPIDAYVVKVDPTGGLLEYYYIDRTTSLLDARAVHDHGHSTLTMYDDYRPTFGIPIAWHLHVTVDGGRQEADYRLQDASIGSSVSPTQLAIPASASIVAFGTPRETLPAKIIDDRVIVAVQLGARLINLQLDSGSSGIAIDTDVISALGYTQYGSVTSETAGTYAESSALVPQMTIGALSMRNVYVSSIPFAEMADEHTPVAGLLGFDFIYETVLHLDYANGTVEAFDPQTFVPPAGTVSIPIALDDGVPAIDASVGSADAVRFVVDTGSDNSVLFSSFATAHPSDVIDHGLGSEMEASFPFLQSFEGVGGSVSFRPVQVGPLSVGHWTFAKWLFQETIDPTTFEITDYDGLIGQDLLRYYDVYLDYPHNRILLAPNARYTDRFGS